MAPLKDNVLFVVFVWSHNATDLVADLVGVLVEVLLDLNVYVCPNDLRADLTVLLPLRLNVTGPEELVETPQGVVRQVEIPAQPHTLQVDGNHVPLAVFEVPLFFRD